jgi:hypothetical protein
MANFFMLTLDSVIPEVHITQQPDILTITGIEGSDICRFAFTVNRVFTEYRVKVVPYIDALEPIGVQIGTVFGSVNMQGVNLDGYLSGQELSCELTGLDLQSVSADDGDKIIKVFAKTVAGNWSVV